MTKFDAGLSSKSALEADLLDFPGFRRPQSISLFIESRSNLATANRVCRALYAAVQTLRRFPEKGRPGIEDGTRELVVAEFPAYTVTYRIKDRVEILRVWHGAQQRR